MPKISLILRLKGSGTALLGLLFAAAPSMAFAMLGAELSPAADPFVRLFGLLAICFGAALVLEEHNIAPAPRIGIVYALADTASVAILLLAISNGVFNSIAYGLAAIYASSALLYSYTIFSRSLK